MGVRVYKISCERCGCEVITTDWRKKYCDLCREDVRREQAKSIWAKAKRKRLNKRTAPDKTIREVIQELETYNKEHNTRLSYGQYVFMTEGVNGNN